jgi:hypothetical protein
MPRYLTLLFVLVGLGVMTQACRVAQPTVVRGDQVPGLDDAAMSTGLDRRDLERLLDENMASFYNSRFYNATIQQRGEPPTVAIMPMENWTTEHVEPQLHALIGMIETQLV